MDFSVGEGAIPGRARNERARVAWVISPGSVPSQELSRDVVRPARVRILISSWCVPGYIHVRFKIVFKTFLGYIHW